MRDRDTIVQEEGKGGKVRMHACMHTWLLRGGKETKAK